MDSILVAGPTKKVLTSMFCWVSLVPIIPSLNWSFLVSISNKRPQYLIIFLTKKASQQKSNSFNGQSVLFLFLLVLPNSLRFLQPGRQVASPILSILILLFFILFRLRVSYFREFIFSGKTKSNSIETSG